MPIVNEVGNSILDGFDFILLRGSDGVPPDCWTAHRMSLVAMAVQLLDESIEKHRRVRDATHEDERRTLGGFSHGAREEARLQKEGEFICC